MALKTRQMVEGNSHHANNLSGFSCIEFRIHSMGTIYLSRLWQTATQETCFLIKEGSAVLEHLRVGDEIEARILNGGSAGTPQAHTTRIADIRRETSGRFKGHHLIVVSDSDSRSTQH